MEIDCFVMKCRTAKFTTLLVKEIYGPNPVSQWVSAQITMLAWKELFMI